MGPDVRAGFHQDRAREHAGQTVPMPRSKGAASAALRTGAVIEIHTEKGALAEKACVYFTGLGLSPAQLVLCHMDKRPTSGCKRSWLTLASCWNTTRSTAPSTTHPCISGR